MARKNKAMAKKAEQRAKLQKDPPFALLESFRNLASNLSFAIPQKDDDTGRVICISSVLSGEGKTTLAVNLALACAKSGSKTILLDCDLRKPSVRRVLTVRPMNGMLEYLSGNSELESVIVKYYSEADDTRDENRENKRDSNLDVIVATKSAPNPLLLLKSGRFSEMLNRLAMEYDYIIIDTPPLGIVSDALEIGKNTDGIVLVVRQMISRYPLIRQVVSQIEFANINFLGFILNDYKVKDSSESKYQKYYRYGYYSYKNNRG